MNRLQYIENGIFLRSCIEGNDKIMALSTNHFSLLLKKWQIVFLIMVMGIALPFWSGAQVSAGVIGKSQCITSGGTPSAFTSLRDASGAAITWEKADDINFTTNLVTIGGATSQTYSEGVVAATKYYRRVVNSIPVAYSNVIKISVVASVANPTFTPQVPPLPIICRGVTSFPVNYTSTNSPNQYSIIWDASAVAAGFADVVNLVLGATPGNITVAVPGNAAASTYNGTLIAIISGTGCTVSNASSVQINSLPSVPTGANGSRCGTGIVNISASAGSGETIDWYAAAAGGTALTSTSLSFTTPSISSTTVYYAESRNITTTCVSTTRTAVTATINTMPSVPTGANGSRCGTGIVNISASAGSGETIDWYAAAVGGTALTNTSLSFTTPSISSTTVYYAESRNTTTNCVSATRTPVTATVNAIPSTPVASNGGAVCAGSTLSLSTNSLAGATYAWTGPNSFSSSLQNPKIPSATIAASGMYSLTVAVNGCVSAAGTTVATVNAIPSTPEASNGGAVCAGSTLSLSTNSLAGANYAWTGPNSFSSSLQNPTIPSATIAASGTYSLTVAVNGCMSTAGTTVAAINLLPIVSINNPAAVCSPGTVDITAASITAGSSNGLGYTYFTNSANTNILSAPSAVNTSGTYYIKGTAIATGCAVSKAVVVSINPQPVVVINTPAVVCAPATINLTANAITAGSDAGLTFTRWTNAVATLPLANDNAVAVSGTYYIKGSLATGCAAILPVSVTINPPPSVVINNPAAVCTPGTIDLTQNIITLNSTAGLAFTRWTNAAATIPLINETAVNTSGTYFIKGLLSTTGCAAVKPVSVIINPLPNGIVQTPTVNYICEGSSVLLTASVSGQYQWYADQQMIAGATNANYTAVKAGTYTVQFTSNEGCVAFAGNSIRLDLLSKSVLSFTPDSKCVGTQITFTNLSVFANSGGISWLWDFGDGASSNGISPLHLYTKPGTYSIKLIANNIQCNNLTDSKTMVLTIEQPLPGIAYASVNAFAGTTVTLQARTFGIQYLWQPNTGLSSATIPSPVATVSENKIYTVSITSTAGCITTDTVQVKLINSAEIFLPQGFTPNGDGQNDKLYPILVGIGRLSYFKIFNRWGNLVFQTNDAAPANGWTGKFNGTDQPPGTYVWIAEAVDVNGNTIKRSGNVLLIR